jgi:putative intracellular protease/amidase
MMKQTVHLGVYDSMTDWEFGYVAAHIHSPEFQKRPGSFEIKTVGKTQNVVTTKGGLRVLPDLCLEQLIPEESALLILPGSDTAATGGIDHFAQKASVFLEAGVPVAAICGATVALARCGLLDDVAHTSNAQGFLEMTGYKGAAYYQQVPAVSAGQLITASGVAPIEFAVEIFRMLDLYTESTLASWVTLFRHQDDTGFYELMAEHK